MNPWTDHARRLAPALLALALVGCGLLDKRDAPVKDSADAVTEPAPDLGDPKARFEAALLLFKRNQLPAAEKAFIELERDFPEYAGPATNLGLIHLRKQEYEQAVGAFSRAQERGAGNATNANGLGIAYRELGQLGAAETCLLYTSPSPRDQRGSRMPSSA